MNYHEYYPYLARQIENNKPVDIFIQDGYWNNEHPEYITPIPEKWINK
ncbi:MAG: hypothetical protein U9Q15_03475 [Patescibacteria group bacterium]|nr:hypothetical protein [Patescibacteria group bacterium]